MIGNVNYVVKRRNEACTTFKTPFHEKAYKYDSGKTAHQVWSLIRHLAGMENVPPILHDIVMHLLPLSHKRTARSIVGRLILAAAAYHVD
nr:hypothetical protein [Tanacetum cinerariifolium]